MGSRLCAPKLRDALFLSHFQLPGVYKPPQCSQIIQSPTCSCPDHTSPRLVSTFASTATPGFPMPSRLLLFWCYPALVHQEDRRLSLTSQDVPASVVNVTSSETFTRKSPQVLDVLTRCTSNFHSQVTSSLGCAIQVRIWLSLASQHLRAIQVHVCFIS